MKVRSRVWCGCFLSYVMVLGAAAQGYQVKKKIELGGDGGWDYLTVDNADRRLYIARATRVMVVDLDGGKLIGEIPEVTGAHGVAVVRDLGRGFATAGQTGDVVVFDTKDLKTLSRIKAGESPDAILYDSFSKRLFVFNGRSKDATVIDAASSTVAGTIPLGGKPEAGVSDGQGKVFVNIEDTAEIAELDAKEMKVLRRWKLGTCEDPTGLAFDAKNRILFSACGGNKQMAISSADKGELVTTVEIGAGSDGAAFDPDSMNAFSTNGEGSITVVHEDSPSKFTVSQTVTTQRGARTVALDPKTHQVLTMTAQFGPAPAPTAEVPRPRPVAIPGTFAVLIVDK